MSGSEELFPPGVIKSDDLLKDIRSFNDMVSSKYSCLSQSGCFNSNVNHHKDTVYRRRRKHRMRTLKPYDLTDVLDFSKLTISTSGKPAVKPDNLVESDAIVKPKSQYAVNLTHKSSSKDSTSVLATKMTQRFQKSTEILDFSTLAAEIQQMEKRDDKMKNGDKLSHWNDLRLSLPSHSPSKESCNKKEPVDESQCFATNSSLLKSCSQEAKLNELDATTADELASYFDELVYIPKKMSEMAEMMYT